MGREVRRVPKDWQHPRDSDGKLVPLHEGPFSKDLAKWLEGEEKWKQGLREDWTNGGWKPIDEEDRHLRFTEWNGRCPVKDDYMPEWPEEEKTHLMMYETCSEGTPLSPAFETPEELARWLADTGANAFGGQTASYEGWLAVARGVFAPSAVYSPKTGLISGVEATRED